MKRTVILEDRYGNIEQLELEDPLPKRLLWGHGDQEALFERWNGPHYKEVPVTRVHDTRKIPRLGE